MASSSYLAIVDDQDTKQILYSSDWRDGGKSLPCIPLGNNMKFSMESGGTATFNFTGTSIAVFGSINRDISANISMGFDIDNSFTNATVLPSARHQLWSSSTLEDGQDTLVITNYFDPVWIRYNGTVFLDYIMYAPTRSTPRNGVTYFMDDQDSRIIYAGDWIFEEDEAYMNGTISYSNQANSSLEFSFEGTGVAFHGTVWNVTEPPMVDIVLDDGSPSSFGPEKIIDSAQYGVEMWAINNIEHKAHHVTVTLKNDSRFSLDYILIQPGPANSAEGSGDTAEGSGDASRVLAGAVAGGVVGGIAFMVGIMLCAFWYIKQRRRKNAQMEHEKPSYVQDELTIPPSLPTSPPLRENIGFVSESGPSMSAADLGSSSTRSPSLTPKVQVHLRPPEEVTSESSSEAAYADSGLRFDKGAVPPPSYTRD